MLLRTERFPKAVFFAWGFSFGAKALARLCLCFLFFFEPLGEDLLGCCCSAGWFHVAKKH